MTEDYRTEIYKLLKIGEKAEKIVLPSQPEIQKPEESEPVLAPQPMQPTQSAISSVVPFDLPIVEDLFEEKSLADQITENILGKSAALAENDHLLPVFAQAVRADVPKLPSIKLPSLSLPSLPKISFSPKFNGFKFRKPSFKGLMLYPVIFVISFAFFYVLLNFSSLVSQVNAWFAKPEAEEILQEDLVPFYTWIGGYYFSVQNAEMLEPANDIDKDGLANIDEFIIRTNPTISDSDADGINDGLEIINGTNPWGEGPLTAQQKKLVEQMDVIKINNRVSYNSISNLTEVPVETPQIEYDLNKPGVLSIPKLNMQVPLIWTKDPKDFDADLTKGVVHYPGTAMPGDNGTVYISGHSSDYLWKKHAFKQVFSRINALDIGDDIFIDIYGADGKTYNYRYRVSAEKVYKPDDQAQFIDNSVAKLNLSTCWPIGTQKDRYVVSATLVPL